MVPTEALITLGVNLAKRGANTKLGKTMIKDAIDFDPTAYKKLKNRLYRKKFKKTSSSYEHSPYGEHLN